MHIQIDSREKPKAIKKICAEFDKQGIPYFTSKMYVGDYMSVENPMILIDRKQDIAEIAQNATKGHDRFKRELERMKEIGAKMYILIEQYSIDGKPIKSLDDIILWRPKYGTIVGMQIYRVLSAWEHKYDIEFLFCKKSETGARIIELLGEKDV